MLEIPIMRAPEMLLIESFQENNLTIEESPLDDEIDDLEFVPVKILQRRIPVREARRS